MHGDLVFSASAVPNSRFKAGAKRPRVPPGERGRGNMSYPMAMSSFSPEGERVRPGARRSHQRTNVMTTTRWWTSCRLPPTDRGEHGTRSLWPWLIIQERNERDNSWCSASAFQRKRVGATLSGSKPLTPLHSFTTRMWSLRRTRARNNRRQRTAPYAKDAVGCGTSIAVRPSRHWKRTKSGRSF